SVGPMQRHTPQIRQGFPGVAQAIGPEGQYHCFALAPPEPLADLLAGTDDAAGEEGGKLAEKRAHPWLGEARHGAAVQVVPAEGDHHGSGAHQYGEEGGHRTEVYMYDVRATLGDQLLQAPT